MPLKTSVEETRCLEVVGEAERWLSRIKKLQQVIDCDSYDDCNDDGCDGGGGSDDDEGEEEEEDDDDDNDDVALMIMMMIIMMRV